MDCFVASAPRNDGVQLRVHEIRVLAHAISRLSCRRAREVQLILPIRANRSSRVGKATTSAVAQRAKAEACPPSRMTQPNRVGTAQMRLCPPSYGALRVKLSLRIWVRLARLEGAEPCVAQRTDRVPGEDWLPKTS